MKQIINSILKISAIVVFSCSFVLGQTFNGSIVNTAGNSAIPSTGTGGCTVAPQTTGGTIFNCTVSGLASTNCLRLAAVRVNFTHTFTSDIDMFLVSPTGQILELSTDNGGGGDNFLNTTFCDTAINNITAGLPPYTGIFRPEGTLTPSICFATITPNVTNCSGFTVANGTWQLLYYDDVGADVGIMSSWSLTFEPLADIVTNNTPNLLPLAPGTCLPAGGIACISPVGTVCPIPTAPVSIRYSLNTRPASLAGYTVCGPTGVTLPGAGAYRIYWISVVGCVTDTASTLVTVQDLEPPTFVPACPKGNLVSLNAGPGECEVSWDAPQFMAMDNCPASTFVGANIRSVGCTLAANNGLGGTAGFNTGLLFDIQNTSARPLAVTATWFMPRNDDGNTYRIYAMANSGSFLPNIANPAAWTLISGDSVKIGQVGFPPAQTRLLVRMGMARANITSRTSCTGQVINDTAVVPNLILQPGEIKGMCIYGMNGGSLYYVNGVAPCSTVPQGDANLKMILNNARAQFGPVANGVFNPTGFFSIRMFNGDLEYVFGANMLVPVQTCGQPYAPGCFFPIGCTRLCYSATDAAGNIATCEFNVCVNAYPNPINALACQDDVQVSLDQNCSVTLNAEMFLSGGPYKCYRAYRVEARLWTTVGTGGLIDRQPNVPGVQLGSQDLGRDFRITVIDTATGNSCWSHATLEDKWPPSLTCPPNITVACNVGVLPSVTGNPIVNENCSTASLTYRDDAIKGTCALGYAWLIRRTFTAVDASGNRSTCTQTITVSLGDIFDVTVPRNYDNIDAPMLNCNEKIDRNKDVSPHMSDFPECVDGYLLDSAFWRANPNQPNVYPNRRLPRVLGWNCIDKANSPNFGHPNPDPLYYPQHRQWTANNPLCWGPDTHVMWQGTGRPVADCWNFNVFYQDIIINLATEGCDAGPVGCYKVNRRWTVMDWCNGTIGGHVQIVKVADAEGPQVLYPDSARVNMESFSCSGRWEVPPAWLIDNCSNEIHYSVEVERGTILGNETAGYVVVGMPEGIQTAYIVATDCCGNITKKRVILNVVDRVPPTAICRTRTVVGINGNQSPGENVALVCAEAFDEGSYDNCQPHVWFKVIRMTELLGTNNGSNANNTVACNGINGDDNAVLQGNQVYFDDCTYFCCSDINQTVMVVLRVFDVDPGAGPVAPARMNNTNNVLNGRFSDCMVEVQVQNKSVPTVVAPPNIVVSCWFWFDINLVTNPNDATFGRVVTDLTAREKVVTKDIVCHKYCERNQRTQYPGFVQTNTVPKPAPNLACDYYNTYFDTAHWDTKYELVWGFDGYVLGACGATPTITVNDLRECGQGQIQRVISTVGPNNLNVSAIQTIWVVDCDPFYVDDATCNDPRFTDLMWPNGVCTQTPVTVEGCGGDVSPDNPQLGRPQVINNADDNCALLSIEYRDEIFTIEPDACFKILRTWIVIDWCQYDPFIDPDFGRWEATQVIKVRDRNKPVVTCAVGPCEPATLVGAGCVGHISLTADATDNCSPIDWLLWEYKIDAFNDGVGQHAGYDFRVGSLTKKAAAAGDTVEYSHNPYADDRHNPFDASGTYPIGIHKICWFVEDGCGNVGVCCTLFEINDCKAPTPYCLTGIITVPMPATKCIDIWAKDLDHGSFDNCTSKENLKFYFDGDPAKTSIRVCCDDFVAAKANDELRVEVEMWVEDEEGNKDYCKTVIIVQDNLDVCPNTGNFGKITGELKTNKGDLANADVQLYYQGTMMTTRAASPYTFGDLNLADPYMVKPIRNDNHLNGVSTQDISIIQKHVLSKTLITNPYLLIAADVNNSGSVTSSDISEIRKLILGVQDEFRKVSSWTFVPSAYQFADPIQPWNAPRTQDVKFTQTTTSETQSAPFIAIKYGDVNENAKASNLVSTSIRTEGKLKFILDEKEFAAGEEVKVSFKASDFFNVSGYQFTLRFDNSTLNYQNFVSGAISVTEENFGLNRLNNGILTTSWNSNSISNLNENEVLFTLVFTSKTKGKVSTSFSITSEVTIAEAYINTDIAAIELGIRTNVGVVTGEVFELYQNEPNPFNKQTTISYRLPEAGKVNLTIYDIAGKVLRVYNLNGQKGLNSYSINKSNLIVSGIFYYQLDASNQTATKKMVIIE